MQRSQQLAASFLLGAFLVGGTLGFTVDRLYGVRPSGKTDKEMMDEFSREMSLTPAQRLAVDSIMDDRNHVMDSIFATVRPSLRAARDESRRRIALRLSAEQRVKFQGYIERQKREAAARQQQQQQSQSR